MNEEQVDQIILLLKGILKIHLMKMCDSNKSLNMTERKEIRELENLID